MSSSSDNTRSDGFRGHLNHISLQDLLQLKNLSRYTGVFVINTPDDKGSIHFMDGEIVHAKTNTRSGESALYKILCWNEGQFDESSEPISRSRTINESIQFLLLNAARKQDKNNITKTRKIQKIIKNNDDLTVLLTKEGEIMEISSKMDEEFYTKILYLSALGDKIGKKIQSGTPTSITVNTPDSILTIKKLKKGAVEGKLRKK